MITFLADGMINWTHYKFSDKLITYIAFFDTFFRHCHDYRYFVQ
jgi:hypothetical protein